MEHFHYVSVENCMRKYGQEGFFQLTYVEPNHPSDQNNQASANDFQCLMGYFECVNYLPCGMMLSILN